MDLLEATVREALGGRTVRRVSRIQSLWSGYGELVRLEVDSRTVVVKVVTPAGAEHPRGWGSDRGHARKLRSYQVEAEWYRHWASRCPVRVPRALHLQPGLFVLEDLDAAGFAGRRRQLSDDDLSQCIRWLARFHRAFLGVTPTGLWPVGTYWHLQTRPDELQAMEAGALRDAAAEIDARLSGCSMQTLVHGDAKAANFCFGTDVAAVDFQYVGGGVGVKDLVYLLGALPDARLETQHDRWVAQYFGELDRPEAEAAWRPLVPFAWADFERFLVGWAPSHAKRRNFTAVQTRRALLAL